MKRVLSLIILGFFLWASCTSNAPLGGPPSIFYGEDVCDECGMIISDSRFASGYTTKEGVSRKFDDIGGMFVFLEKNEDDAISLWVPDYGNQNWVKASEAYFVVPGNIISPMGHGIIAFSDKQKASQTALKFEVEILSLKEIFDVVETHDSLHKHE